MIKKSPIHNYGFSDIASLLFTKEDPIKQLEKQESKLDEDDKQKQYEAETMETGKVNLSVYKYYITNMGLVLFGSCIFFYIAFQVCTTLSSVWLSIWSDQENNKMKFLNQTTSIDDEVMNKTVTIKTESSNLTNLGIFALFGLGQAIFQVLASLMVNLSTLQTAKTLHNNMLKNILRSPLSFFDTTPQGRILNRFGKDIDALDTTMPWLLRSIIPCLLSVIAIFIVITYTTPYFLLPVSVILVCYYFVQQVYVAISRQLKRLESVSKSPIFSHFGETLNGTTTIQAYDVENKFIKHSEKLLQNVRNMELEIFVTYA